MNQQFHYKRIIQQNKKAIVFSAESCLNNASNEILLILAKFIESNYELICLTDKENFNLKSLFTKIINPYKACIPKHRNIKNLYWDNLSIHYDVKWVIEDDPSSNIEWMKLGIPVWCVSNPLMIRKDI